MTNLLILLLTQQIIVSTTKSANYYSTEQDANDKGLERTLTIEITEQIPEILVFSHLQSSYHLYKSIRHFLSIAFCT
jgi:hypothetical protein